MLVQPSELDVLSGLAPHGTASDAEERLGAARTDCAAAAFARHDLRQPAGIRTGANYSRWTTSDPAEG